MNRRLQEIKKFLAENRNHPNHVVVIRKVAQVMNGWLQYFRILDCGRYVRAFALRTRMMIYRWFNRRGKTGCANWKKVNQILKALNFREDIPLRSVYPNSFPTRET